MQTQQAVSASCLNMQTNKSVCGWSSEILRSFHALQEKVRPSLTIATLVVCHRWMWRRLTALCCRCDGEDHVFADDGEEDDDEQ